MLEAGSIGTSAMGMASIAAGPIFEETSLEIVSQLEELAARSHAYEVICSHLDLEHVPLQARLTNH